MPRFQFTIRGLLLFTTGVAVLLSLVMSVFIPSVQSARDNARRCQCRGHLMMIGLALQNYQVNHGAFPPACVVDDTGRPMHSWRVLVLPYMEENALYAQYDFDEPWNGPNNRRLARFMPGQYRCPLDTSGHASTTSYLAVVGRQAALHPTKARNSQEITDGTYKTIIVVEVADSGVNWMEPRDISLDEAAVGVNREDGVGIRSSHAHAGPGVCVGFADGSVDILPEDIAPELLRGLLTIDGGEDVREFK